MFIEKVERRTEKINIAGREIEMKTMHGRAILKAAKVIFLDCDAKSYIKAGQSDVLAIIAILCACEAKLPELLSAIMGIDVSNEFADELTLEEFSIIAVAFTNVNDFSIVRENFLHAIAAISNQLSQKRTS